MITVTDAAAMLGISKRKMYDLAAPHGPIPCYRLGKRMTRFNADDVRAYAESCKCLPFDPTKEAGPAQLNKPKLKASSPGDESGLLALFKAAGIRPRTKRSTRK